MEAGNAFLPGFMERFNAHFAKPPARADDRHRPLNIEVDRLSEVFCLRVQRYVGRNLTLAYDNKRVILEVNDLSSSLVGTYVDVYEFPDGRLQVRHKGLALPHRIFDKNQRVTHASITENKRLSEVLAYIKDIQDQAREPVAVPPSSARNGYVKTGRKPPGGPSKLEGYYAAKRAARAANLAVDV